MSLPAGVTVKLNLYTLACRELLNRLSDLRVATQTDARLDYQSCLRYFDESLKNFFERSFAEESREAAGQLANALRAQAGFFRNKKAAAIFNQVADGIRDRATDWQYQADLERFHIQGRELARRFFAASPWPETQARLGLEGQLSVEYGAPDADDRVAFLAESFGYRAAPLAYYPRRWDDELEEHRSHVLLARFTFGHDFALYLAYPFLFLHEYTAHIFATDYENERFNDGWMLHAAAAFLKREWVRLPDPELQLDQADIFYERLYPRINSIPRRACHFAQQFDYWASAQWPDRFTQLTHELAAFEPQPGEKEAWPTQLINALENEFSTDRERLRRKVRDSATARELMTTIAPV